MKPSLKESAKSALEYLHGIAEKNDFSSDAAGALRLNTVIQNLRESLQGPQPCQCISPQLCDAVDRCCKFD
jgi:hypothetical protein